MHFMRCNSTRILLARDIICVDVAILSGDRSGGQGLVAARSRPGGLCETCPAQPFGEEGKPHTWFLPLTRDGVQARV